MEDILKSRAHQFETFLRERGKRITPERSRILTKAVSISGHFDAEELHRSLEEEGFHVSLATVYNSIDLMYEAGLLRKHIFDGQQARFEAGGDDHIHLVCLRCGRIQEARGEAVFHNQTPLQFPDFFVNYYSATFYGLCSSCARGSSDTGGLHKERTDSHQQP
ncbi:MAG: transcriptional repressor [Bacteroidales bacterium]|nr:transcriptional repressor [Bacteroidales bacterium]